MNRVIRTVKLTSETRVNSVTLEKLRWVNFVQKKVSAKYTDELWREKQHRSSKRVNHRCQPFRTHVTNWINRLCEKAKYLYRKKRGRINRLRGSLAYATVPIDNCQWRKCDNVNCARQMTSNSWRDSSTYVLLVIGVRINKNCMYVHIYCLTCAGHGHTCHVLYAK